MFRLNLKLFVVTFCLLWPGLVLAHGGEKHDTPQTAPAPPVMESSEHSVPMDHSFETVEDDISYGAGSEDPESMSNLLFEEEDPLDLRDMEPMAAEEPHAGHQSAPPEADHSGHDMASMKKIELAEHEWVSSSQKGYGLAVGVTVLAGLAFGFLSIKRPFE